MSSTLALTLIPETFSLRHPRVVRLVTVLSGSWVIALLAQIHFYLPFSPVPVTGQTLGMLAIAAALGSRCGAVSVGLYLIQGAIGLPFFSGGAAGLFHLVGPTAGYLWGMIPGAYLVGRCAELGWDRKWFGAPAMFILGLAPVFLLGAWNLATVMNLSLELALNMGVYPFLGVEIAKGVLLGFLFPTLWKFRESRCK